MGRITEIHFAVAIVTIVMVNICSRELKKYTLMHGRIKVNLI